MKKNMENICYILAGVVAFGLQFVAEDYAVTHRLNSGAIGGEIFVALVIYGVLFLAIRAIFSNLEARHVITEKIQQPSCITATATIDTKGICRVVDAAGKKKTYKNLGEYVKTL